MTQTLTALSAVVLPRWDTFEVVFFFFSGVSVGVAFGFLFPSLWRTLRRRFWKNSPYLSLTRKYFLPSLIDFQIVKNPETQRENENTESQGNEEKQSLNQNFICIADAFVLARYFFVLGKAQESIAFYIRILTYEDVSKQQTYYALYELSQVYESIGLRARALDAAFELLFRKPQNSEVLRLIIKICSSGYFPDRLEQALKIYKGPSNASLRLSVSHALSTIGEVNLERKQKERALYFARSAVRWERRSGRAFVLLWQTTSQELWNTSFFDAKIMWTALATDLSSLIQIFQTTDIPPTACSKYLSVILGKMSLNSDIVESYFFIQEEFTRIINFQSVTQEIKEKTLASLFYAMLSLNHAGMLKSNPRLNYIIEFLLNPQALNFVAQQDEAAYSGYSFHRCNKCHAFFSEFAWKCVVCGSEESLYPQFSYRTFSSLLFSGV